MEVDIFNISCVPYVIGALYHETYFNACQRLLNAGVPYNEVPVETIEKLLYKDFRVLVKKVYKRKPLVRNWTNDGVWVAIVDRKNTRGQRTHCMIFDDGRVIDNHSEGIIPFDYDGTARIYHAWKLNKVEAK